MSATFKVDRCFVLPHRGLFVLAGAIAEGMVQIGMHAELGEAEGGFAARVHGVEFVDRLTGIPGTSGPALTFSYGNEAELQRWRSIEWPGRELRLTW